MIGIDKLAAKAKMRPAAVRAKLRRHKALKHRKGERWEISDKQIDQAFEEIGFNHFNFVGPL